ncbi:hypothetical protein LINPERPRIM_LOCUS1152 [Linum perenne]
MHLRIEYNCCCVTIASYYPQQRNMTELFPGEL